MGFNIISAAEAASYIKHATTLDSAALLRQEHRKP